MKSPGCASIETMTACSQAQPHQGLMIDMLYIAALVTDDRYYRAVARPLLARGLFFRRRLRQSVRDTACPGFQRLAPELRPAVSHWIDVATWWTKKMSTAKLAIASKLRMRRPSGV